MSKLTLEQRRQMLVEYSNGKPLNLIAQAYGVSRAYPSHVAAQFGITRNNPVTLAEIPEKPIARPKPRYHSPKPDPKPEPVPQVADVGEIRRLASKGIGRTRIAAQLRCKYREVEAALA